MRSRLLLVAIGALLALAAVLWMRASPGAAIPEPASRLAEATAPEVAPQLVQPAQDDPRIDRGVIEPAAPPVPATPDATDATDGDSSWTGIRVRVVDEKDGKPVVRARVRARTLDESQSWKGVNRPHGALDEEPITGADGVAELELAADTSYEIQLRHDDERNVAAKYSLEPPLAALEVRELVLQLKTQPDLRLHGRVVDRETNLPIAGARVGRSRDWNKVDPLSEQRTDVDGRFEYAGESWRQPIVNVLATGYEVACVRLVPRHATPETALEITLSPVATLSVTVLDAAGAPVPEVRVTLWTALYRFGRPDSSALLETGRTGDAIFSATTDARGVARITDLPPRMPFTCVLRRGREELLRPTEALTLSPGETREVEWRIGEGCTIHGVALETDGKPAPRLAICLESAQNRSATYFPALSSEPRRTATTDDAGAFSFTDVSPGNWLVGPAPNKFERTKFVTPDQPAAYGQLVAIAVGVPRVDVELRVHRGLTIQGRVLDPTGAPVRNSVVDFTRASEKLWAGENVNHPDGIFVLGPLHPGEYELRASSHGGFVNSEKLIAHAGDTDVELRLRAGGKISGVVVDNATGTATAAEVVIRPHAPVGWSVSMPSTNDKGVFEMSGLAPGLYDVAATTSNGHVGLVRSLDIAAGAAHDLRIEVQPGARVRVRYEGPWPHCGVSVLVGDALTSMDGIEKGTERIFVSMAGSVVVRIRYYAEQKDFDLPLTLTVGETRDVVFDGAWK